MTKTQEQEELWCKVGRHFWTRPKGTRGRKPVACDQHRGSDVAAMNGHQPDTELPDFQFAVIDKEGNAACEDGSVLSIVNGPFNQGAQGMVERTPKGWSFDMFEDGPAPSCGPEDEPVEVLHCKHGHDWRRPPQAGKKPIWCPEHRPKTRKRSGGRTEAPEATPAEAPRSRIVVTEPPPTEPVPEKADETDDEGRPLVILRSRITLKEIEETYHPDRETMAKLEYIDKQLNRKRSSKDANHLRETQDQIIARLRHRAHA